MFGVLRPSSPERLPISPTASPPQARSLAPLPPSVFNSREELLEGCKNWSTTQGYAIVIARSRLNRLWLKCDRGGTYENRRNLMPDQRKRKRGDSRLLGCPFRMIAACQKDGTWSVSTEVPDHNHGPSEDMSAHPTLRRMTDQQLHKVHEMFEAGKSPAETLEELKQLWPDIKVLTRDIYNARKKYKTLRDEAEATAGGSQEQQYQDPNELGFPGPNPHGKWAWVPDGEQVTDKRSRRKRRSAPALFSAADSTLDPQLQTPDMSHTITPPESGSQPALDHLSDSQDGAEQLQGAALQAHSQPNQTSATSYGVGDHLGHSPINQIAHDALQSYSSSHTPRSHSGPSSLHSRSQVAPTASMSSPTMVARNEVLSAKARELKAQEVMSRIERMEKEQADQKNMLSQILGAMQGFSGNPGSELMA